MDSVGNDIFSFLARHFIIGRSFDGHGNFEEYEPDHVAAFFKDRNVLRCLMVNTTC